VLNDKGLSTDIYPEMSTYSTESTACAVMTTSNPFSSGV
jgi:hypothetical protein